MPTRCTAITAKSEPCRAYAVPGTDPPRCASHGGAQKKPGAPAGNTNALKHGFYAAPKPGDAPTTIEAVIEDLAHRQQALSDYLAAHAEDPDADITKLVSVFLIHGQNASRLGRLLRDKRAISGDAADGITGAIARTLDELSTILGTKL